MDETDWFKKSIIYHILIDRFSGYNSNKDWNKPIFLGGTLKGIIERLSYLKKLGVNTLWISPFYKTSAYHGYHITDFTEVDPHYGTKQDLKKLIYETHENDMHIIVDFVPNHCSKLHPFFIEAQKNKNSQFFDWFYFTKWPNEYLCFLSIGELPKLNLNNIDTREHIINSAKKWLSYGIDGFRLDHVIGPKHKFWNHFKKTIKEEYPNTILIGEAWMAGIKYKELKTINIKMKRIKWLFGASPDSLLKEYYSNLDGVLDFRIQEILRDEIAHGAKKISNNELLHKIKRHLKKYPKNYFLPTFLDNHDMNRFLFECNNDKEKLKQAAKIQFSLPSPPIIYYGTEQGISQKDSIWSFLSHGDLQARKPINWNKTDDELFKFYKKLIEDRKKNYK